MITMIGEKSMPPKLAPTARRTGIMTGSVMRAIVSLIWCRPLPGSDGNQDSSAPAMMTMTYSWISCR